MPAESLFDSEQWTLVKPIGAVSERSIEVAKDSNRILLVKALRMIYDGYYKLPHNENKFTVKQLTGYIVNVGIIQKWLCEREITLDDVGYLGKLFEEVVHPLDRDDDEWYFLFKRELNSAFMNYNAILSNRPHTS
ncbi:MAG: hypothetical protein ABI425_05630 [Patescibacteria group bacterium]